MVAYSFKPQFIAPIVTGTKRQTVRADRKRHARVGETLQLYTGMRTTACRMIGQAVCVGVGGVRLDFARERVELWTGVRLTHPNDLDVYAVRDGFNGWDGLMLFWAETHDLKATDYVFTGVQIEWGATFQAPEVEA